MFTIRQNSSGQWEVVDAAGTVLSTFPDYTQGLVFVGGQLATMAAMAPPAARLATAPKGALAERWVSGPNGVALQEPTGDGRDFSECVWTFRDGPLPLMFHNVSDWQHIGAVLAGWADENTVVNGTPFSAGWFHDSDAGRALRDVLVAQGRFGVSVDPGAVTWEDRCTEVDEDGWCIEAETWFLTYDIAGMTAEPFPGFETAWIELGNPAAASTTEPSDAADDDASAEPVAASGTITVTPRPARLEYSTMTEPPDDDPRNVPQLSTGGIAVPLTIEDGDDAGWRHVYGHIYPEGACHIGYPNECRTAPSSPTDYANFNLHANPSPGGPPVGTLVYGLDHAPLVGITAQQARDHYANTTLGWASVRASNGRNGGWFSGVVRADVTPHAVNVLRASGVSGDWREWGDYELDMFGLQSCNLPGFPITRQRLVAAGGIQLADPLPRITVRDGRVIAMRGIGIVRPAPARVEALVASGMVHCSACGQDHRPAAGKRLSARNGRSDDRIDRVLAMVSAIDRRTRHLIPAERDHLAARIMLGETEAAV